jgi:hypothetical protein
MKKNLLILAAATAVAFAACNGGNNEGTYTQAQVDSMQKAQTDSIEAAMKAQTDSTIAAQAQRTADSLRLVNDSLMVAASAKSSTTTTTTVVKKSGNKGSSTTTKKETTVNEPATIGKGKPAMGNDNTKQEKGSETVGAGKPKM